MNIENSYSPLDKSEIEAFETEIGHGLPEPYKPFLMQHNGGEPEPSYFCYKQQIGDEFLENCSRVQVFLGLTYSEAYELMWTLNIFKHRVPINFLLIAENGTGGLIYISLYGDDEGSIYFWDMELEKEIEEEYPDYDNA